MASLIVTACAGIVVLVVIAALVQPESMVGDAEVDARARFGEVAPAPGVGLAVSASGGVLGLVGGLVALTRSTVRSR